MKVSEVMSPKTTTIKVDATIRDAAEMMKANDIGCVPVTDEEKIHGMLTDRDIVVRCIAAGKDPATTRAQDVMSEQIKYVFEDQDLDEAARSMMDLQMRRMVVLNRDKRLVGVLSMGDICNKTDNAQMIADLAKCCSEPSERHSGHKRAVA